MRILMLMYNLRGKGTYWRALYLARGLAKQGHEVTIVCTPHRRQWRFVAREDEQPGVTVITSPNYLGGPFASGWDLGTVVARLLWSLRQADFDIVHGFESRPSVIFPALYWQRLRGATMLLDWVDWFGKGGSVEERPNPVIRAVLRPFETFFEDSFRKYADGSTAINETLYLRLMALCVQSKSALLLPNGSNTEEITPIPKRNARKRLMIPQDAFIIGYIGAIFEQDAILMAHAFDCVQKREPKAQLLLIGYCNIDVEKWADRPTSIKSTGRVPYDQISEYLAVCDVCWLPLRDMGANWGRSPLKIKDYMAAGRPVVVTSVGDAADLVRRGEFGLVVSDKPDEIAGQTVALLRAPERREVMGHRARQLAEKEFSWLWIAGQLEQFYRKIIGEKHGTS